MRLKIVPSHFDPVRPGPRSVLARVGGRLLNPSLSVITVVVFLGTAEGLCRLLEWRAAPGRPVASYIAGWQNWDGEFYTVKSTAFGWPPWEDYNSEGLRDREHAVEKRPGTWRLVCLGDSVTLGGQIRPQQAFPQVLERLLQAAGLEAEVFNVALFGWSTRQERIAYRKIARRYKPDQVLLGVCLNDIPELQNNLTRPPRLLAALYPRSALVRRLVGAREREIADVEELFAKKDSAKVKEAFGRFFAEVRALRDDVQADGARFGLLVLPFRFQVRPGAPSPSAQEAIGAFCRAEKIAFLDLLPVLQPLADAAFIDYDHLSARGARRVAEEVMASGLVAAGGPGPGRSLPGAAAATSASRGVGALLAALRAGDERASVGAARALGNAGRGSDGVAAALVAALGDPRPAVRAAAAWALGDVGPEAAAAGPALVRLLRDPDPHTRAGAAYGLGGMGAAGRAAVPALVERLADADENVRWRASDALGQVGMAAGDALGPLVTLLEDRQGPGRGLAAEAIGRIKSGATSAVPALIRALDDRREEVRWRAVWALGQIGPTARSAVPALLEAWKEPALRWRVADAFGGIGPEAGAAVPTLTAALEDDNSLVRWRATSALGLIGPAARSAVPGLLGALRHPESNVRWGAVVALDRLGVEARVALPAYGAALGDEDVRVRGAAAAALGRLGPAARATVPELVALLKDSEPGVRVQAARALGRIGALPAPALAALQAALGDERPRVREEAARALGRPAP